MDGQVLSGWDRLPHERYLGVSDHLERQPLDRWLGTGCSGHHELGAPYPWLVQRDLVDHIRTSNVEMVVDRAVLVVVGGNAAHLAPVSGGFVAELGFRLVQRVESHLDRRIP